MVNAMQNPQRATTPTRRDERELVARIFGEVSDDALYAALERWRNAQRDARSAAARAERYALDAAAAWDALVTECRQTDRALTLLHATATLAERTK
jgi:hypothetical protein